MCINNEAQFWLSIYNTVTVLVLETHIRSYVHVTQINVAYTSCSYILRATVIRAAPNMTA